MSQLLTFHFWFDGNPVAFSPAFATGFFVLFALLAIGAAVVRIAAKRVAVDAYTKQALRMAGAVAAWLSFLGFLWLFCTYEEVQVFGMRFWFLLWLVILVASAIRIAFFVRNEAPKLRLKNASRSSVNAYLPRRVR